ncbi:hypothetical protein OHA71_23705 [Streptomyces sp. NBC_00444]|uniref:hypothetical protein n=1 Tax=Streptomyces sp. NBC_00444 TaxID=2975744 RepID=UPI002E1F208C
MTGRYLRASAQRQTLVRQMLVDMADRLEANRPDQPLTPVGRIALIQATAMAPNLSRLLRVQAPEITASVTRREYAAQLRRNAEATSQPQSRAQRVDALHQLADEDYAEGQRHQDLIGNRDDAHLIAGASESAQARVEKTL